MSATATRPETVFDRVARAARTALEGGRPLRRNLPGEGRLHLDRPLPFLVVYRRPPGLRDEGTDQLVTAFSAYLVTSGEPRFRDGIDQLIRTLAEAVRERLGAFLLLELWTARDAADGPAPRPPRTAARVVSADEVPAAADELVRALEAIRLSPENGGSLGAPPRIDEATLDRSSEPGPPGLAPLELPAGSGGPLRPLGLEIEPFFRDPARGTLYPRVLHTLRVELNRAVERALFRFAQDHTTLDPPHARALGRTRVGRATRHVDDRLGEVHQAFDVLLQVTPVNAEEAWNAFTGAGCERAPCFRYRPLPFDPEHLKRRLFHVPIENVEDPLLSHLFREKQEELDRQVSLVRDLETPGFRWGSCQLYGTVDEPLLDLARRILASAVPPEGSEEYPEGDEEPGYVDARGFADAAEEEILWYRSLAPGFNATVEIRDDVAAGLMVSRGALLVSETLQVPRARVNALIQHEVGTHLVTWVNGSQQPFRLFAAGLSGYDALQEGLAVLSEYLVGGLTRARMRVLAGRVLAVWSLQEDATFVDTFRLLTQEHGFGRRTAFVITMRVHRGGGLTKDAGYLRGLRDLLAYVKDGGGFDLLLVGKLGLGHAPVVQELVLRGILELPMVKPRYTSDLAALERLGSFRRMKLMDMVENLVA